MTYRKETHELINAVEIEKALNRDSWGIHPSEGRLMLAELLIKSGAGFRSSYTEERFLSYFNLTKKDGTPNKKGRLFLCKMFYKHSNNAPDGYYLIQNHRRTITDKEE